jgi:hypothetical protein
LSVVSVNCSSDAEDSGFVIVTEVEIADEDSKIGSEVVMSCIVTEDAVVVFSIEIGDGIGVIEIEDEVSTMGVEFLNSVDGDCFTSIA